MCILWCFKEKVLPVVKWLCVYCKVAVLHIHNLYLMVMFLFHSFLVLTLYYSGLLIALSFLFYFCLNSRIIFAFNHSLILLLHSRILFYIQLFSYTPPTLPDPFLYSTVLSYSSYITGSFFIFNCSLILLLHYRILFYIQLFYSSYIPGSFLYSTVLLLLHSRILFYILLLSHTPPTLPDPFYIQLLSQTHPTHPDTLDLYPFSPSPITTRIPCKFIRYLSPPTPGSCYLYWFFPIPHNNPDNLIYSSVRTIRPNPRIFMYVSVLSYSPTHPGS